MAEFKLTFNADNAAFTDYPEAEIARILRLIADRVESGETGMPIIDINGNKVGEWEYEE